MSARVNHIDNFSFSLLQTVLFVITDTHSASYTYAKPVLSQNHKKFFRTIKPGTELEAGDDMRAPPNFLHTRNQGHQINDSFMSVPKEVMRYL